MKYLIALFFISFIIPHPATAIGTSSSTNKYVGWTVELQKKSVKAGSAATMLIKLKPVKGIHINLDPAMKFTLDSSAIMIAKGNLEIPKVEKYLDISKPIKQSITLTSAIPPGKHTIKGTLTYYYCSDAEGWCSKFKQPVEITINVVK